MIAKHSSSKTGNAHPLIRSIAAHRESQLEQSVADKVLYRPELKVYFRTPPLNAKKSAFFKRKELFLQQAADVYKETLECLARQPKALLRQ